MKTLACNQDAMAGFTASSARRLVSDMQKALAQQTATKAEFAIAERERFSHEQQ